MKIPDGKKYGHLILIEVVVLRGIKSDNPDMTDHQACVFNTFTKSYSDNSIYESTDKGYYFNKDGRRWYLKDFE